MVIWEITLGTAYFLGLKRTYRLALRIQRRLVPPNQPKTRAFLHRRTRAIFNVATKVHKKIQERDMQIGRNLGNWILRWRDKINPTAQIVRSELPTKTSPTNTITTNSSKLKIPVGFQKFKAKSSNQEVDRHNINKFISSSNILGKPFSPIAMMMRAAKPVGNNMHCRYLSLCSGEALKFNSRRFGGSEGVIREDIRQWMLRN